MLRRVRNCIALSRDIAGDLIGHVDEMFEVHYSAASAMIRRERSDQLA